MGALGIGYYSMKINNTNRFNGYFRFRNIFHVIRLLRNVSISGTPVLQALVK